MVLDLVLQAAVVPRRPPVGLDVQGGDALEPEKPEVHRGVERQHRHGVMVHVQHQVQYPAHGVGEHKVHQSRARLDGL